MVRLGLEALVNPMLRLSAVASADARPGRKVLTLVARDPCRCVPHRPRRSAARRRDAEGAALPGDGAFHARHLLSRLHLRAHPPARRGDRRSDPARLVVGSGARERADDDRRGLDDLRGARRAQARAAFGYTKVLGLSPALATRADTGEVLHARLRKGSLPSAARSVSSKSSLPACAGPGPTERSRCGPTPGSSPMTADRHLGAPEGPLLDHGAPSTPSVQGLIDAIDESAWLAIGYPEAGMAQVAETTYVTGGGRPSGAAQNPPRRPPDPPFRPRANNSCGPPGATTPLSPTSSSTPSRPTPSTAPMRPSSLPSGT